MLLHCIFMSFHWKVSRSFNAKKERACVCVQNLCLYLCLHGCRSLQLLCSHAIVVGILTVHSLDGSGIYIYIYMCTGRNVLFRKHWKVKWNHTKTATKTTLKHSSHHSCIHNILSILILLSADVFACMSVYVHAVLHNQNKNIERVWNTHAWQTASTVFNTFWHFSPNIQATATASLPSTDCKLVSTCCSHIWPRQFNSTIVYI